LGNKLHPISKFRSLRELKVKQKGKIIFELTQNNVWKKRINSKQCMEKKEL
jgi:hypothetical protein